MAQIKNEASLATVFTSKGLKCIFLDQRALWRAAVHSKQFLVTLPKQYSSFSSRCSRSFACLTGCPSPHTARESWYVPPERGKELSALNQPALACPRWALSIQKYSEILKDRSPTARSGRWDVRTLPRGAGGDAVARKESEPCSPLSLPTLCLHFLNNCLRQEGKSPPASRLWRGNPSARPRVAQMWETGHRGRNNATSTHKLSLKS